VKAAIVGANGQLGVDVSVAFEEAGHEVVRLDHSQIEIADADSVTTMMDAFKPDAVINTAAMHNVEQCEKDPVKAFTINGLGAQNLARACSREGAYFLHVSTDYVFDGGKKAPYVETDTPRPLNVYGNTKLSGEYFATTECADGAVLRVSGVYGKNPCRAKSGLNFVNLMLKLASERSEIRVVDDEILTPSSAADIARQVLVLTEQRAPGLFHGTAQGECSWFRFAQDIFALSGVQVTLNPARPGEFPAKVPRPSYSVLDNAALRAIGLDVMPPWQDGLRRYLAEIGAMIS
jgi:dTDP-4-dehydrorhamnose reductase